jgi:PAN domain
MKKCPVCGRAYHDETLNFCLEDGAALFVQVDPDKTVQISPRDTDSILTRISYPTARPSNPNELPKTTMLSPEMTPDFTEKARYQTPAAKTGGKFWFAGSLLAFLTVLMITALVWFNAVKTNDNGNSKNQNANRTNTNDFSQNKKSGTSFTPLDYQASLNGENLTYYQGTTVEQCQADCAKNEKCRGFTYIRAGAYNPNDAAMCYLASKVTGSGSHACCISAIKR